MAEPEIQKATETRSWDTRNVHTIILKKPLRIGYLKDGH